MIETEHEYSITDLTKEQMRYILEKIYESVKRWYDGKGANQDNDPRKHPLITILREYNDKEEKLNIALDNRIEELFDEIDTW